jgi:hypothetical protein
MVNGHVYPQVSQYNSGTTFAERPLLFHNIKAESGRRFEPPVKDSGLAVVIAARGAAFDELFNDGKIDVVINPVDDPPLRRSAGRTEPGKASSYLTWIESIQLPN